MKSVTVLKLKLDSGDGLVEIAEKCRRGRNAASEDWLLRQRGKDEMEVQKGKKEATKLYHSVTSAVPDLDTQVASSLGREVNSFLSGKLDWRRQTVEGKQLKRRDAILDYQDRSPYFTALKIPVLNSTASLVVNDRISLSVKLLRGKKMTLHITAKLPLGIKRILRDLSTGKRKFSDSQLLWRRDDWYWIVPVSFESEHLNPDVEATLSPVLPISTQEVHTKRPFDLVLPTGRTWGCGDGRYLLSQEARHISTRKQIGWRYRQKNGAGHGRKKIDATMRRLHRQIGNIRDEVRRRIIVDIVRQCERAGVGTLVYREPTGPAKTKCWFEAAGITWDWTRFHGDLKNACARRGVKVSVQKLKVAECLEYVNAKSAG